MIFLRKIVLLLLLLTGALLTFGQEKITFSYKDHKGRKHEGAVEFLIVSYQDGKPRLYTKEYAQKTVTVDLTGKTSGDLRIRFQNLTFKTNRHQDDFWLTSTPAFVSGGNGFIKPDHFIKVKPSEKPWDFKFDLDPKTLGHESIKSRVIFQFGIQGKQTSLQTSKYLKIEFPYLLLPPRKPADQEVPSDHQPELVNGPENIEPEQMHWEALLEKFKKSIPLKELIPDLIDYIDQFPKGRKFNFAKAKIEEKLQEAFHLAQQKAEAEEDVIPLKEFIRQFPRAEEFGGWITKANQKIKSIQQQIDQRKLDEAAELKRWQEVQKENSKAAYDQYIAGYGPAGKFYQEAVRRSEELAGRDARKKEEFQKQQRSLNPAKNCKELIGLCDRYLRSELQPANHFPQSRIAVAKVRKEAAKACNLCVLDASSPGAGTLEITLTCPAVQSINDIALHFYREGVPIDSVEYPILQSTHQGISFRFIVKEVEGGNHRITASTAHTDLSDEIYVQPRAKQVVLKERDEYLDFRIRGGQAPFFLRWSKEDGIQSAEKINLSEKFGSGRVFKSIRKDQLLSTPEPGAYTLLFTDANNTLIGKAQSITQDGKQGWELLTSASLVDYAIAVTSVVLLLYCFFVLRKVLPGSAAAAKVMDSHPEQLKAYRRTVQEIDSEAIANYIRNLENTPSKVPPRPKTTNRHGITVVRKETRNGVLPALTGQGSVKEDILKDQRYLNFDLKEMWGDSTTVSKVLMRFEFAAALNRVIREESDRYDLAGQAQPEIGGFILGRHGILEDKSHLVTFEKYIPAPTERQDVYEIEFGTDAMRALDIALERHTTLELVGWFHTHPGHTLFLSQPDLRIQQGFFKKPYQIAMEIDTLSSALDLGFFSWKNDKEMNNCSDRKTDQWLSWEAVCRWRRDRQRIQ